MAQHQPPALSPEPPPAALTSYTAAPPPLRPVRSGVVLASYLLMGGALLLVMWRGLLPGLLCVCLGFLLTRALTAWIAAGTRSLPGAQRNRPAADAPPRSAQVVAAAVIMLMPLALLAAGLTHSRGYLVDAPQQYRELLTYMARTVLFGHQHKEAVWGTPKTRLWVSSGKSTDQRAYRVLDLEALRLTRSVL